MSDDWKLAKEYYEHYVAPPMFHTLAAFTECQKESHGFLFLESQSGGQLQLQLGTEYGVCEYSNYETKQFLYAMTPQARTIEIPRNKRLEQCCNCCAVGMNWYPAKCHIPRAHAITIVESMLQVGGRPARIIVDSAPLEVEWLDLSGFLDGDWD